MTASATVQIRFTSFWLSGTGMARGRDVDDVTYRDRYGCPAMPMTQVKGQLRETAERLAGGRNANWELGAVTTLFGDRVTPGMIAPRPGALAFRGEACLPQSLRAHFGHEANHAHRAELFRRIDATRIGELGAAEDKTLRSVEVAVPLTISGQLELIGDVGGLDWLALLDAAAAATLAFGKLKADGYGRALAKLEATS